MNKKEIAQQYTRQILEQEPARQAEQQDQNLQETKELEQIKKLLLDIQLLYIRLLENYLTKSERPVDTLLRKVEVLETKAENISRRLQMIVSGAEHLSKTNDKVGSRWAIRLYLIAVLTGICAALITLLLVWIKRH